MMPPDLSGGLCAKLAPQVLEATFFASGPQKISLAPGGPVQRAWDAAKEICIECPIFLRCRAQAMGVEYGVMGGLDEHERHLIRRRKTRALERAEQGERAALAARMHARHAGGLGETPRVIARNTGYSTEAVNTLIAEHEALLEQRPARPAPVIALRDDTPVFPAASPPRADGWVWYRGRAAAAHYVGETADGEYVLVKIKPHAAQTTKWVPKALVSLRTKTTPVVREWVGRAEYERGLDERASA
jgi:hypothetical protein